MGSIKRAGPRPPFSFKYTGSALHDVASSQQRAVAIDDVVALSDALQVSRVLGEFPMPDLSLPRGKRGLRVATPVASTTGRP
jgi:hypothetical protein